VAHESVNIVRPRFFSKRRILITVTMVPWAYLAWSGYNWCYRLHVVQIGSTCGHEGMNLYVTSPATGLVANVVLWALANKFPVWLHVIIIFVQLILLAMVLAPWGGGI
jgi:hypothetical protein